MVFVFTSTFSDAASSAPFRMAAAHPASDTASREPISASRPAASSASAHSSMIRSGAAQAASAARCMTPSRAGSSLGMP